MRIEITKFTPAFAGMYFLIALHTSMLAQNPLLRNTISLNGTRQIAEGKMEMVPVVFNHTVQVMGDNTQKPEAFF